MSTANVSANMTARSIQLQVLEHVDLAPTLNDCMDNQCRKSMRLALCHPKTLSYVWPSNKQMKLADAVGRLDVTVSKDDATERAAARQASSGPSGIYLSGPSGILKREHEEILYPADTDVTTIDCRRHWLHARWPASSAANTSLDRLCERYSRLDRLLGVTVEYSFETFFTTAHVDRSSHLITFELDRNPPHNSHPWTVEADQPMIYAPIDMKGWTSRFSFALTSTDSGRCEGCISKLASDATAGTHLLHKVTDTPDRLSTILTAHRQRFTTVPRHIVATGDITPSQFRRLVDSLTGPDGVQSQLVKLDVLGSGLMDDGPSGLVDGDVLVNTGEPESLDGDKHTPASPADPLKGADLGGFSELSIPTSLLRDSKGDLALGPSRFRYPVSTTLRLDDDPVSDLPAPGQLVRWVSDNMAYSGKRLSIEKGRGSEPVDSYNSALSQSFVDRDRLFEKGPM